MDNLGKLQKLTLGLIISLTWFTLVCFVVIFLGNVFQWSFLSVTFSMGFFTAFGIGLGALVALAILHLTLTLNSISFSLFRIARGKEDAESVLAAGKDTKLFARSIFAAVLSMIFVVLIMWYGEVRVNNHKVKVALNSMESLVKSPLANKLVAAINADATIKEVLEIRDAMMNNLVDARGLSILTPVNKVEKNVFYELTPWWYGGHDEKQPEKKISEANLAVFVPQDNEKKKFHQLLQEKKPFYSRTNYALRVFFPVVIDGKIECILLLDTSRQDSDAYLLKRGSSR